MQAHEQDVGIELSVIPRTQSSFSPLAAATLLSGAVLILFCLPFLVSDAFAQGTNRKQPMF